MTVTGQAQRDSAPLLLFDGVCAICNRAVRFILTNDRAGLMRFAPLDGNYAAGLLANHPELSNVDSIVLITTEDGTERIRVRSDAALAVARYLGGVWRVAGALRIVPRPLRDAVYDGVARIRYRAFGRYDVCPVPPPEVRSRFLD